MPEPIIKDVSDTAYWIAYHRAVETQRADPLFRDPFAGRLAGERGRRIATATPVARFVGWTVAIRTRIIDDYIRYAIAHGADTVLNLGAGLDTRPYRMDLPASLRWIEADYPGIIEYKETQLVEERPCCVLERVKIDLANLPARRQLLADVNAQTKCMLVLTEGVVPYLTPGEAAVLTDDLRSLHHAAWWIVDYFSQQTIKYRRSKGMDRAMGNAPFRFTPDDPFAFFNDHGWRVEEIRYLAEEGERLHRPTPLPPLTKIVLAFWGLFLPTERKKAFKQFVGYMLLMPTEKK